MKKLSKITALVGSLFLMAVFTHSASAEANPFAKQVNQVQTIAGEDGKCGDAKDKKDAKCGDEKKDKKCGEGKCGDAKDKKCGDDKKDKKCGEGKCGDSKEKKDAKCGDAKSKKDEGKCGGK